MLELYEMILFRIFLLVCIVQFDITIVFSISHFDNLELSPMLVYGPILTSLSITQLFPIITGPSIDAPSLIIESFPRIMFPEIKF